MRAFWQVAALLVLAHGLGQVVGCMVAPKTALDACADEARAALQAGSNVDEAMGIYEGCKNRKGIH